ncbi:alpha-L-rhamnosidase N-terminal domain-containing protein [Actinomyces procaprae]|uniref:alpha-L-rhamnosidase N-terminal domain-containing protein n=1 Tax=Actinomyces procaprae TaxID=2560010 RepID=UPI0010A27176|nr:alpha-L-rhamnosidase N-terminal domain-containing protein [Actinomyces procaprae]
MISNPAPLVGPVLTDLDDAAWLATPTPTPVAGNRPAYELRTHLTVSAAEAAGPARLTATAHGIYEAFINGARVGDVELAAPGATSYRKTLYVQTWDVAGMLCEGENELRLVVSDGWFRGRCGPSRVPDNYGEVTAVIAALTVGGSPLAGDEAGTPAPAPGGHRARLGGRRRRHYGRGSHGRTDHRSAPNRAGEVGARRHRRHPADPRPHATGSITRPARTAGGAAARAAHLPSALGTTDRRLRANA